MHPTAGGTTVGGRTPWPFHRTSTARAGSPEGAKEYGVPHEVFEHLPHGIAVTDRVGALVAWNGALEEILGLEDDPLGKTCCELFGCGGPNGAQGGCLTEQAIRAGGRPLEGVIQRSDATPLWTTVAPLRDDGSRLVFEVRRAPEAGTPTPRRARVAEGAQVQVFTFGRTEVLSPGGPLGGDWLGRRTGQLLKYLTCERHRVVPTEEIAESFSGHAQPSTLNTVRYVSTPSARGSSRVGRSTAGLRSSSRAVVATRSTTPWSGSTQTSSRLR